MTKDGIQQPLPDCVKNQEVTWSLPNKVYNIGRHKLIWSHTILKVKMNFVLKKSTSGQYNVLKIY